MNPILPVCLPMANIFQIKHLAYCLGWKLIASDGCILPQMDAWHRMHNAAYGCILPRIEPPIAILRPMLALR